MKILEKVDWGVLDIYINEKLIITNKHPDFDIWILNYSPKAQSKKNWDIYTLSCRGLVIDGEGNILARPFQKFKNFEEHESSEIDMSKNFDIFEKMDGSKLKIGIVPSSYIRHDRKYDRANGFRNDNGIGFCSSRYFLCFQTGFRCSCHRWNNRVGNDRCLRNWRWTGNGNNRFGFAAHWRKKEKRNWGFY